MKKYTIYDIKKMAKEYGFRFFQAKDYCYFFPVDDLDVLFNCDSVGVYHWSLAHLNFWEGELIWKIEHELNYGFFERYQKSKYWKHASKRIQEFK